VPEGGRSSKAATDGCPPGLSRTSSGEVGSSVTHGRSDGTTPFPTPPTSSLDGGSGLNVTAGQTSIRGVGNSRLLPLLNGCTGGLFVGPAAGTCVANVNTIRKARSMITKYAHVLLSVALVTVVCFTPTYGATEPLTLTICIGNPVPPGWTVIKTQVSNSLKPVCKAFMGLAKGPEDQVVIQQIPALQTVPAPWRYDLLPNSSSGALTLLRTNGEQQQLCRVSVTASGAFFACADVAATIIPLAELLKR